MANEERKLEDKIREIQAELISSTGIDSNSLSNFNSFTYFNLDELVNAYSKEVGTEEAYKNLAQASKSVKKMRSSYLPIELFMDGEKFSQKIADTVAKKESYENAFMRMLGMPQSERIAFAERIKIIDLEKQSLKEVPYETVKNILKERNFAKNERTIDVASELYNIDGTTSENSDAVKILNLDTDFIKLTYLLVPPIQDSDIVKCINEPEKMVAEPFSRVKVINGTTIKTPLIESIIRIRLDKMSGTNSFSNEGSIVVNDSDNELFSINTDTYGILEALFVLRLRSALSGLAKKMLKDIDNFIEKALSVKNTISEGTNTPDLGSPEKKEIASVEKTDEQKDLEARKLIEDSIMVLLEDNSGALDLQNGSQRKSSIFDSVLMSGLLGVIDIPRKRIESRLKEISNMKSDTIDARLSPIRSGINTTLGIEVGVGSVDLIVFALALFTMSEEGLLGLLTENQLNNMKKEGFSNLLPGTGEPSQVQVAIDELTELVYAGYKIFMSELDGSVA